ncbi:MAG: putative rubrerythrin Rbr [Candidatus Magnetoglobus multicellularis str. Araruama]|uniref:Putative rubrerythrin Rbr n=1 Tax=Candidatus Magnetoglobus multicellularis str. Araruama TaxID=890399 RepID=A0A1V1PHM3_9BACT|nr:MAG: putative rubrerythrin Rbr [Candidatus Magnetoglobus multicellularis str. Araruama]
MNFNNIDEIIKYAIEKEIEAEQFYLEAAAEAEFTGARQLFEDFAKEENKHKTMLETLDKDQIHSFVPETVPDLKRSNYLVDMTYEKGMGFADILRLAMKREEKANKLYLDLSQKAGQDDIKKLFEKLAQEESKHKFGLERMYDDYMATMGD